MRYKMVTLRTPDDLISFIMGISGLEVKEKQLDGKIPEHEKAGPKTFTPDTLTQGESSIHGGPKASPDTISPATPQINKNLYDGKVHRTASGVFRALRMLYFI